MIHPRSVLPPLLVSASLLAPLGAATTYRVTTVIPGFVGTGFNAAGQVSGYSASSPAAGLWNGASLSSVEGITGYSQATAINSAGAAVGYSRPVSSSSAGHQAFIRAGGAVSALPDHAGHYNTPVKISDSGTVVGTYTMATTANTSVAYLYAGGSTSLLLPGLGGALSTAADINAAGWVAGSGTVEGGAALERRAWLYDGTTTLDLGTLGGLQSTAYALNDSGHIVGGSTLSGTAALQGRAFLYRDGQMTNLQAGTAWESASGGYATDINNSDDIVGRLGANAAAVPFLWEDGVMHDLRDLIEDDLQGLWFSPVAINDEGEILMFYNPTGGERTTVILSPVPEPSTALTLALGAAVAFIRRRRPSRA